ncbi:MAG: TetR/AcrR family transcriptional regulator [Polyangiaceae bacterium]|nr:TetR/AcrR family transcriptional regulator [Polyangiaceae bacterium]
MGATKPATGGRRFRGQSPEERVHQRREQLLEAGLHTFGARGFHAVGVREICAAAGLTERYFYESFTNREALYVAVFERSAERIRAAVNAATDAAPKDVGSMARAGLRAYLETLRDEPNLARVLLIDVFAIGPDAGGEPQKTMESFARQIAVLVRALFPDLTERQLDAELVANGLFGSTLYQVLRWATGGYVEPVERVLDHCVLFYEALAAEARKSRPNAAPAPRATPSGGKPTAKRRSNESKGTTE